MMEIHILFWYTLPRKCEGRRIYTRTFQIPPEADGKRLDKWIAAALPALPYGKTQSAFRRRDIKINGRPAKPDARLSAGDEVTLYVDDAFLDAPKPKDKFLTGIRPRLKILHEDENLLIVDKPAGLLCHPDEHEKVRTLLTEAQAYLYQKGVWDSQTQPFAPALCNRVDRFTGGLVMIALNEPALKEIDRRIRLREVEKRYIAILLGRPKRPEGTLTNWLLQPDGAKRVQVFDRETPAAKKAQTRYRVLTSRGALTLVECELLTGRTHQIRAQFAHAALPLLGDGQYGDARRNRRYGREGQALYAYRLCFRFSDAGPMNALNGRSWEAARVPFAEEFFGKGWKNLLPTI